MADHFEDEPLTSGKRGGKKGGRVKASVAAPAHSAGAAATTSAFQFDGIETAMTKEELKRERRRRRRDAIAERTGKIVVCCCCILLLIGIICAIVLTKEVEYALKDHSTHAPTVPPTPKPPTPAPVPIPTMPPTEPHTKPPHAPPTPKPTVSPEPTMAPKDRYEFTAIGDTYVYKNGPDLSKTYGREKSFLVQKGIQNGGFTDGYDAIGLLMFDTTDLPDRVTWPDDGSVKITLKLRHIPKELSEQEALAPTNMNIVRLPNNHYLNVESLSGAEFKYSSRLDVTVAQVASDDEMISIDITRTFFADEFVFDDQYNDEQLFLLLEVRDIPQEAGEEFATRESDRYPAPQLVFTNMLPSGE